MTVYYGGLFVGDQKISRLRDGVSERLLAAFTDASYAPREVPMADYWHGDHDPDRADENQIVHEWTSTSGDVADRLDALGITLDEARAACESSAQEDAERRRGYAADPRYASLAEPDEEEVCIYLGTLTLDQWAEHARRQAESEAADTEPATREARVHEAALSVTAYWPEELLLRVYCFAFPDEAVRFDITEMIEEGFTEELPETLCSSAASGLAREAMINSSTVVLVEGKSDARALSKALRVLAPHLLDLIKVMDFERKPEGNASALSATVRAFAAAGIANTVVALFDNDTAAAEAMAPLSQIQLPPNIHAVTLPPQEIMNSYPTIGPIAGDDGEPMIVETNINGLAGSIELYFGRDVLEGPDGMLTPVQWTSYMGKARRYQGEIINKAALQEAFGKKCDDVVAGRHGLEGDWSGMSSIIDRIKTAHQGRSYYWTPDADDPSAGATR